VLSDDQKRQQYDMYRKDKENKHRHYFPIDIPAIQFLQTSVQDEALKKQLSEIADLIVQAKQVIFLGVGTSLSLAEYGSYLFSGIGILSFAITNPFYSLKLHHSNLEDVLVIALSVSGETEEVLTLVQGFKERNAKIVSLTNTDISTLSSAWEKSPIKVPSMGWVKTLTSSGLSRGVRRVCRMTRMSQRAA